MKGGEVGAVEAPGGIPGSPLPIDGEGRGDPGRDDAPWPPDGGRFLVIVPTYNERENVGRLLPEVLERDDRIDVLVVDDASPDGTADRVRELSRDRGDDRLHLLSREGKHGLAGAYLEGFRWGLEHGYDLLVEMDADLSHPPGALPEFFLRARGWDVVIGSRYVGGRVTVVNWPIGRLLLSLFGSWYARIVTGLPVSDATGGFNCWRREVLEALDLNRIGSEGYAFQIELKLRAWRRDFRILEVPIVFTERETGESKMSKKIVREAVWRVWHLRLLELVGRL